MGNIERARRPADQTEIMQVDRMRKVLRLAAAGRTVESISVEFGMTHGAVMRMLNEGLKVVKSERAFEAEHYRELVASRLEYALEKLAPGVDEGKVFAIEKWNSINMNLAKLYGLDEVTSPAQINVNVTTEAPALPPGLETSIERVMRLINTGSARLAALGIQDSNDVVEGQIKELNDVPIDNNAE